MAGDFNMAGFAMMRAKPTRVLGDIDVNSYRVNSHQTRPLPEAITRVTLCHKYTPFQRVLASPHRTRLLALKGYYIDENQVIQKDPNFNIAPMATKHKAPSPHLESVSSLATETPHTPSPTNSLTGVASARDTPTIPQETSASGLVNMASTTPDSFASNVASSPLDKELPPKPVLRFAECPGRRGMYDAFDSGSQDVKYPILLPSPPDTASPGSTGSDETGFQVSPSLRSALYSRPELGVGTAVEFRKLSAVLEDIPAPKMSDLPAFNQASSPLKVTEPGSSARRLPTKGQITAIRNGSPVSRQLSKSKFNSRQGGVCNSPYGSLKRVQQLKATVKQDAKVVDDVFRAVSANCSDAVSPQRFDDLTRRYTHYGVGPTVRYAEDAHQIIMGDQSCSDSSNKSAGTSAKFTTTGGVSKLQNSKDETQMGHDTYPPRVSSLPASPNKVAARLARPTKASVARAEANSKAPLGKSGTMTSVKKLGSRLSSILPGRSRSSVSVSIVNSKSMGAVDEKNGAIASIATVKASTTNANHEPSINGRAPLTPYENSGRELQSSGLVGDVSSVVMGEPSDRDTPQQSQRDKQERRAAAVYISETRVRTNAGRAHEAGNQQRGGDQDDDEPPTPPPAGIGPQGHYAGSEQQDGDIQQELQRELEMLRQTVITIPPGVYAQFNQLHAQAQRLLSLLTLTTGRVDDPEARNRVFNLVEAIGESLVAANTNTAAIVALADANQRILTATVSLGEYANVMAGRGFQTSATQQ